MTLITKECLDYVIGFLLGDDNTHLRDLISYGEQHDARIVIEPSEFFNDGVYLSEASEPVLPLKMLDGIPVLFGSPVKEKDGSRIIIKADIIASSFFLMTRYEECLRRFIRDVHGRFLGSNSLPVRAGFIRRPIVDEYGAFLRASLRELGFDAKDPKPDFNRIYLTHDVDRIWTWDNLSKAIKSSVKRTLTDKPFKLQPIQSVINYRKYDPASTFDWLIKQDKLLRTIYGEKKCVPIYFLMGCTTKSAFDNGYITNKRRVGRLLKLLLNSGNKIGYHVSYAAASDQALLRNEIGLVEEMAGLPITMSRNHYLDSREPEDFRALLDCGIRDDFTMTYADVAGFRLGTCRSVRWIDPMEMKVTSLTLHPTTIMECTLSASAYMGISDIEEAYSVVRELLSAVRLHCGEAILLWHNDSVHISSDSYHRELYSMVLGWMIEASISSDERRQK